MLGSKQTNKKLIKMYKGETYIETNIKLYTKIDRNSELYKNLNGFMGKIEPVMKNLNLDIGNIIADNFESNTNIAEISSIIKGL